jgi:fatty-acid peroxygenase
MTTTLESTREQDTVSGAGIWQHITDPIRLLVHGYGFISERCNALGTDVYPARLAGLRVVCLRGAEGAEFFYDEERFRRRDALPEPVLSTLTGHGGAQTLDGAEHRHRKELFMSLMTPESLREIDELTAIGWADALTEWAEHDRPVALTTAAAEILSAAVHRWAGVPLADVDNPKRTAALRALYEGPAIPSVRHWRARRQRRRLESEMTELIMAVRRGLVDVADDEPLAMVARHCDADGALLPGRVAAVELLNLLRPTVAVERFVCFAAVALHTHPHWTGRLAPGAPDRDARIHDFVQEVRRTAPFFPVVGARGSSGPRLGRRPDRAGRAGAARSVRHRPRPGTVDGAGAFRPGSLRRLGAEPVRTHPQGGGDYHLHHRCAGEWLTIRLLETAVRALTSVELVMPPQDLRVSPRRVPALPKSGVQVRVMRTT